MEEGRRSEDVESNGMELACRQGEGRNAMIVSELGLGPPVFRNVEPLPEQFAKCIGPGLAFSEPACREGTDVVQTSFSPPSFVRIRLPMVTTEIVVVEDES